MSSNPSTADHVPPEGPQPSRNPSPHESGGDGIAKLQGVKPRQAELHRLKRALRAPFSELEEYAHIPLVDMVSYVNRPKAARETELARCKFGKQPILGRGLLLYRVCYRNRIKAFCKGTVHSQNVWAIAHTSWRRETEIVRETFSTWAKEDLRRHQEAFDVASQHENENIILHPWMPDDLNRPHDYVAPIQQTVGGSIRIDTAVAAGYSIPDATTDDYASDAVELTDEQVRKYLEEFLTGEGTNNQDITGPSMPISPVTYDSQNGTAAATMAGHDISELMEDLFPGVSPMTDECLQQDVGEIWEAPPSHGGFDLDVDLDMDMDFDFDFDFIGAAS